MRPLLLAPFLALALLFAGCPSVPQTPEAVAYDTLRGATAFVDAKLALFEVEVAEGRVPTDRQIEVRRAYVEAKKSINAAAVVAHDGFAAQTPEDTARLVDAFVKLVTKFIPPNSR